MNNLKSKLRSVGQKLFSDPVWIVRRILGRFHPPLFSLQMGKVGSSSIKDTIESRYRVFHCHSQVEFEAGLKLLGNRYDNQTIDLITATRDPVGREISGFFQNITAVNHSYGVGPPEEVLSLGAERLIEIFRERWALRKWVPDTHLWFDRCFLPSTGIDLYAHDFDRERGWSVVKSGRWRVLVVRFEDINRNYLNAINAFVTERHGEGTLDRPEPDHLERRRLNHQSHGASSPANTLPAKFYADRPPIRPLPPHHPGTGDLYLQSHRGLSQGWTGQ